MNKTNNSASGKLIILLFFVTINSFLLSLLLDFGIFHQIASVSFIALLLVLGYNLARNKNVIKDLRAALSKSRILNLTKATRKFLKINKKFIIISTVGLIIANILISQTILIPLNL